MIKVGDRVIVTKWLTRIENQRGVVTEIKLNDDGSIYFYRIRFDRSNELVGCNLFAGRRDEIIELDVSAIRNDRLDKLGIFTNYDN